MPRYRTHNPRCLAALTIRALGCSTGDDAPTTGTDTDAPPILLSELEMQQSSTTGFHEPLLPPPFADDGSRGRIAELRKRGRRRK